MKAHAASYPLPVHGHHPNFRGAAQAANQLLDALFKTGSLQAGDTVLSYPDYVLRSLRKRLLEDGVDVIVPAKYGHGYRFLQSSVVDPAKCSSIAGAERHGTLIQTLPALRMTFVACVVLSKEGGWLSKGYGYRFPEELRGLPSATIVHPLQLVPDHFHADGVVFSYATTSEVSNPSPALQKCALH
jgi:5-formyltetrahydrofolate cyclo-ligase